EPPEWAPDANAFFEHIAKASPRGWYPRGMSGEQVYWTVVADDGARWQALLSEDGALEPIRGGWSIEPFLRLDGQGQAWADGKAQQALVEKALPVPMVTWKTGPVGLAITAAATRKDVRILYRVRNESAQRVDATLALALRPFQVNPPSQFLSVQGGVGSIRDLD